MAFLQTRDLADDTRRALLAARERRLKIQELRARIEKEEPRHLSRVPEDLIRKDRER
jgi:hypothetical protein